MPTVEQMAVARALFPAQTSAGAARQARELAAMDLDTIAAKFEMGEVDELALERAELALDQADRLVRRLESAVRGLRERAPRY